VKPDDHDLFRDDLAERRRERDRQREPAPRWRPALPELARRRESQAHHLDLINAAIDTSITAIECPACLAPVFAPADSSGERIDCSGCDARLVTVQTTDGVTAVISKERADG
jgi:hypothetical protein